MLSIVLPVIQTIATGLIPIILAWALPIFSVDKRWSNYLDVFNRYRNAVEESEDDVICLTLLERMRSIGFIIYGRKMFADELGRQYPAAIFISLVYYLVVVIGVNPSNESIDYKVHVATAAICIIIFLIAFILSMIIVHEKYSNRKAEYSALFDTYRNKQLSRIKGGSFCSNSGQFILSSNIASYYNELNDAGKQKALTKLISLSRKKRFQADNNHTESTDEENRAEDTM